MGAVLPLSAVDCLKRLALSDSSNEVMSRLPQSAFVTKAIEARPRPEENINFRSERAGHIVRVRACRQHDQVAITYWQRWNGRLTQRDAKNAANLGSLIVSPLWRGSFRCGRYPIQIMLRVPL